MAIFSKYVGMFGTLINSIVGTGNITVSTSAGVATVDGSALATTTLNNLGTTAVNKTLNMAGTTSNADLLWSTGSGGSIGVGYSQSSGTDHRPQNIFVSRALIVGSPGGLPPYGQNNALVTGAVVAGNQSNVEFFAGSNTFWNSVAMGSIGFHKLDASATTPAFINLDTVGDFNVYFSLLKRTSARTDYLKFGAGTLTFLQSTGANLLWNTDGGGDIGASGATRPNNIFVKAKATIGGQAILADGVAAAGLITTPSLAFTNDLTAGLTYDPSALDGSPLLALSVSGIPGLVVQPQAGQNYFGPGTADVTIIPWTPNTSGLGAFNTSVTPGSPTPTPYPFNIGYIGNGGLFVGSDDGSGYTDAGCVFAVATGAGHGTSAFGVKATTGTTVISKALSLSNTFPAVAMVSGESTTIPDTVAVLVLTAGGTIPAFEVVMPANPQGGQVVCITSDQTITALTLTPNSGQSIVGTYTSLPIGTALRFIYAGTGTAWLPL
jgi:hypothetical protein